jgi:hypothetical protein
VFVLGLSTLLLAALGVGSAAPPFMLNGGTFGEAATGRAAGGPTVIAFLDFSEEIATGCGTRCLSRAEARAVRSVWIASRAEGLRVVLVDAAPTVNGRTTSVADLTSQVRAWEIGEFPVVQDHADAGLARRYGVTRTPTVFLLDGDGIVRARWESFVASDTLVAGVGTLRGNAR